MKDTFQAFSLGQVRHGAGTFHHRYSINREYLLSLTSKNLLRNHYWEAGIHDHANYDVQHHGQIHWGWESTVCQVRGHFLGHWLSAAAMGYAMNGDAELKGRADWIVGELGRCQKENGGEWVFSVPEKYLHWVARGKGVWAPQYTIHKTLMGLVDMVKYAENEQALDILVKAAKWFTRWTKPFSRQQLDDILDVETGGMLEVWADLYGLTGKGEFVDLMKKYDRRRLFEPLLAGDDPLTNMHANTTVPEVQGAARAYEVTGEKRYRDIAQAYWDQAVPKRGCYATGGQTHGEIWSPPFELADRLGEKTQEHCVVYNMMRLAHYLHRWTGDIACADYYERNLYNGILSQQHGHTGQIAYFLPMNPGAKKVWGSATQHFWCCHGTLVQAHMLLHTCGIYFADKDGLVVDQYIPSTLKGEAAGRQVELRQATLGQSEKTRRPTEVAVEFELTLAKPADFALKFRMPWWLAGRAGVSINGKAVKAAAGPSSYLNIRRRWNGGDKVRLDLPKAIKAELLPGSRNLHAFMDGPVVLAGLTDEQIALKGDPARPRSFLRPHRERMWQSWQGDYHTHGQPRDFRLMPLHEVTDEAYTLYYPLGKGR